MRKISIIGNFADGTNSYNGQTIKTRIVASELERLYGCQKVRHVDTAGGVRALPLLLVQLFSCVLNSANVIILPAQNGIKVILPLVVMYNVLFSRTIHYVVIGGWLPQLLKDNKWLLPFVRKIDFIYPETQGMKDNLNALGIKNVVVMPNCKPLDILKTNQLEGFDLQPMRFCVFSRVTATKGIEDAVKAIHLVNRKAGKVIAQLDIYGKVEDENWFADVSKTFGDNIRYCGCVAFDKSVSTLKAYTALLFPTFYPGEGLAGTVIDAFAAGIPIIASDWHDNANIIIDGKTGFIFRVHDTERMANIILSLKDNQEMLMQMKQHCLNAATDYLPNRVVGILDNYLA